MKYIEANVPSQLVVRVRYYTDGEYRTVARLVDRTSNLEMARGESKCCPKDNPRRAIGRAVAVGRALKAYEEEKSYYEGLKGYEASRFDIRHSVTHRTPVWMRDKQAAHS